MGVVAVLALVGCSSEQAAPPAPTAPVVQLAAPGEASRTLSPDDIAALTAPGHVEADVTFVRDMLYHHGQAMTMTAMVEERTTTRDIRLLAGRMEATQDGEIEQLESWLVERDETVRDLASGEHGHQEDMTGMLSEAELAQLEAAEGTEFDRLFLELMIKHHEGAIDMAYKLYEAGGGSESEVDSIARHVESDQSIEIGRMQQMLAAMGDG
ncbi:DUF305 domain-containing protein [Ornithinimicrobium cerasi]|uniref:DUF305 domain-containing protein n=1 Tax=Ornithinimicrobium cerasi TaxID=2248773 RepID=UPI001483A6BE|nr:DUF305 domain-containing protein [Ornithinimicrobium cerasi]